jgi:hypothetical protein
MPNLNLNLNLNLNTRPRLLIAETCDLKMATPANHPVSGLPLLDDLPNRYPPTASRHHLFFINKKGA